MAWPIDRPERLPLANENDPGRLRLTFSTVLRWDESRVSKESVEKI